MLIYGQSDIETNVNEMVKFISLDYKICYEKHIFFVKNWKGKKKIPSMDIVGLNKYPK